jgi:hypothetical protein
MKNYLKEILVPIARPVLSKVHKYKDAHKGESCYLFGDGVSVKWFDLSRFNDKIAIPCAFIPFHKDFDKLSVKYLSIAEPWWFYPVERDPPGIGFPKPNPRQLMYRRLIKKHKDKNFFINLSNYPVLSYDNINYLYRDFYDSRNGPNYFTKRINAFHGSLRTSISLAIYMGFDHIYLVGYDYTHDPSRTRHWYEKGEGDLTVHENYNDDFFEIVKEYVDITTITLDGSSRCLNHISYKKFTGAEPVYRENTELIEDAHLRVLHTWSGYKIF